MASVIDRYERKVMQIALHQCRCETGADIETERPKAGHDEEREATPHAA